MITHNIWTEIEGTKLIMGHIHFNPSAARANYRIVFFTQHGDSRKNNTLEYCLKRIKRIAPDATVEAV